MAYRPKIIVPNPSGVTSITDGAVGFPITEAAYVSGLSRDGVPYIVAPGGIKLSETTPAFTTSPRAKNGAQVNPRNIGSSGSGIKQAFDIGGGSHADNSSFYSATVAHDPATILRPGDAIVKSVGVTTISASGRDGVISKYSGVHILAAPPAANAFAAPFIWPSDDVVNRPWRVVDVDARLAEIPSFSAAGQNTVTWAQCQPHADALDLGRSICHQMTVNPSYEGFTRYGQSAEPSNYGRYLTGTQASYLIGIMSDAWNTADKTAAFIRVLQLGCQAGEAWVKFGFGGPDDSGHDQAVYAPSMAWLWATGRQAQYATWRPITSGNQGSNLYHMIDAAARANDYVPHSDPLKPYPYRRRNVLAITNGGLTVDVQGFIPLGGTSEDTGSNGVLYGLDLVKESNGNSAYITASSQLGTDPNQYWQLTLSTPVTGLAVSDVVYCKAPFALTTDTPDWRLLAAKNVQNPSQYAAYRNLNHPCAGRMFARAIGMVGSDMAVAEAYLERAMAGVNSMPAQADFNYIGGVPNPSWVQQFYNANWTTLKALPQDV